MNPMFLPQGMARLPMAPPGLKASMSPQQEDEDAQFDLSTLVPPSVRSGGGLWDPGNRHQTLLAFGTGMLSGGFGQAGQNIADLSGRLRKDSLPIREYGGPDNAFEIITDPRTGERTVRAVEPFQEYAEGKRRKQKDVADINGRAMFALEQLPEAERPAAYQTMLQNPDYFGIDPESMPAEYDPRYSRMTAGMGMTVSQAMTRDQVAADAKARREIAERRADIYEDRSAALTRQGDARIGQGAERIAISRTKGSGKGRKAASGPSANYEYRIGPNGRIQRKLKR